MAHAVGDNAPFFRGGRDDLSARAHAEAIDITAILAVMYQLVIGGAEHRMCRLRAETAAVDQRLRMLDAKADGKRLGFDVHAAGVQHFKCIAGAMAGGENNVVGGDEFAVGKCYAAHRGRSRHPASRGTCTSLYIAVFNNDIRDVTFEADLATEFDNLMPQIFDDLHEPQRD